MNNITTQEIKILDNFIKKIPTHISTSTNNTPASEINIYSTFLDVAEHLNGFESFENEREYKKTNAPNWQIALEFWIKEIEEIFNNDYVFWDNSGGEMEFLYLGYFKTAKGQQSILFDFADKLLRKTGQLTNEKFYCNYDLEYNCIESISKGVVYAYKLIDLKKELNELSTTPPETDKKTGSQKKQSELTNKAKVLVLKELGFFELPKIVELNDTKKGILLNAICGGSETNFTDYVGNFYNKNPKDTKNPNTKDAKEQTAKLLNEINLQSEK